jgi:hypothetical protein
LHAQKSVVAVILFRRNISTGWCPSTAVQAATIQSSTREGAFEALRTHWPEYLSEGAALGTFMVSACFFGVRAGSGPGIEFLEYLAPRDRRPYPPEEKANDLIHWQTRFLGIGAEEAAQTLRTAGIELPDGKAGFRKAVTLRDPDGHAIQIVEP